MKNWKLSALLNTPLGVVIVVGTIALMVELLFMALLHEFLMVQFKLSDTAWDVIDAITLTAILSPVLYFLVFRNMHESEERLRQINAAAPSAIVIVNEQDRITNWNLAAQGMFQFSQEEVLGQQLHQLITPPRYRGDAARGFDRFEETGSGPLVGKTIEISALRKDGSEFPVELSISAIKLKGRWHAIGIMNDITGRKQAEEELRLRAQLLDSVSDTIFVLDLNGNFVYLNEAAWKTRGYTRDEMMGINLHVLDTPKYEKLIESRMRDLMENGRGIFESEHRRKDGSVMPVEINARIIELGGRKLSLSIIRDITERKRMDEELQLAHFALNHAVDSVFWMEPSGKFRYVNETACRMLGYSKEELLSMGVADIDPNLPEGVPLEMSQATKKAGLGRVESEHRAKDGHLIPVEIIVAYLQYKGEEFHCSFVRDITKRKQAEQEKMEAGIRLKDALEDAIGAIAATLEQRDPYTAGHQRRVAELAAAIGDEMGLAREVIEGIHFGGLIHDLGKISVPAEILGKPGRLTDIEFGLIKTHAEAGYQIVKGIAFPWPVADMVRQHHERLDGFGYPQGLKGEQIVLEARILAVADVVEAMSSNRPYRPGLGMDVALGEITRGRSIQFDPVAVDACLRVIKEKGFVFTK